MPVSKRDKKVSLTKTGKKGMAVKQKLVEDIRSFLEKYNSLFVFTIHNMRNGPLKDLREEWKDSRFFFAKRRVMAIALGRTESEELQDNLHKLASNLSGQCGLLFTNRSKDEVVQFFQKYSVMEYAKSGFIATETVELPSGPLPEFPFAIEPHLRSLGMPTQLQKGKVVLREDFVVCTQGSPLTPEQASMLKLLGNKMAEFKVTLVCYWSKDGSFQKFKVPKGLRPPIKVATSEDTKSSGTPKQHEKTPKQKNKTPKQNETSSDLQIKSPKQIENIFDLEEKTDSQTEEEKENEAQEESSDDKPAVFEQSEEAQIKELSKLCGQNPRRSMRTPKPIKRTPEQKRMSLKKLTEQKSISKGTPKQSRQSKGTAQQTKKTPKHKKNLEDVEMAE